MLKIFDRVPRPQPEETRSAKVLTMTTTGRLEWRDLGPNAEWQYSAELPSGNFTVVYREFDCQPVMGFIPVGHDTTTHEEDVPPELAEQLYEAINRNIFGDKWGRQKRILDQSL